MVGQKVQRPRVSADQCSHHFRPGLLTSRVLLLLSFLIQTHWILTDADVWVGKELAHVPYPPHAHFPFHTKGIYCPWLLAKPGSHWYVRQYIGNWEVSSKSHEDCTKGPGSSQEEGRPLWMGRWIYLSWSFGEEQLEGEEKCPLVLISQTIGGREPRS